MTKSLRQSGKVLLDLAVRRDGSLYGSYVWRFEVHMACKDQQQQDTPEGARPASATGELPYHRFAHRDALLLSMLAGKDAEGSPIYVRLSI